MQVGDVAHRDQRWVAHCATAMTNRELPVLAALESNLLPLIAAGLDEERPAAESQDL